MDPAALLKEEASLLAAVQAVQSGSAADAAGAEERLKVFLSLQFSMPTHPVQLLPASGTG